MPIEGVRVDVGGCRCPGSPHATDWVELRPTADPAIGAAVMANRTLGGQCIFLETEAPSSDNLETAGAASARWAEAAIVATYTTSNPLT